MVNKENKLETSLPSKSTVNRDDKFNTFLSKLTTSIKDNNVNISFSISVNKNKNINTSDCQLFEESQSEFLLKKTIFCEAVILNIRIK